MIMRCRLLSYFHEKIYYYGTDINFKFLFCTILTSYFRHIYYIYIDIYIDINVHIHTSLLHVWVVYIHRYMGLMCACIKLSILQGNQVRQSLCRATRSSHCLLLSFVVKTNKEYFIIIFIFIV